MKNASLIPTITGGYSILLIGSMIWSHRQIQNKNQWQAYEGIYNYTTLIGKTVLYVFEKEIINNEIVNFCDLVSLDIFVETFIDLS